VAKGIDLKLDKAWAKIVKQRARYGCEKCGEAYYLNAHHVIGKRNRSTRWNISNGCALCPKHHTFDSHFSAHQTPTIFSEWIIGERGEEWHEELTQEANTIKKWKKADKEELLKEFNEMLEEI